MTYHWTLLTKPTGARAPILSKIDTHAARTTTARVFKDGTYVYEVVAIDAAGDYAIADVTLTVKQKATTLSDCTPKKASARPRARPSDLLATVLDQFGARPPFRAYSRSQYSIRQRGGRCRFAPDSLLLPGRKPGDDSCLKPEQADGLTATDERHSDLMF